MDTINQPSAQAKVPPLLSLCMIVKDEAESLGRCLESVRGIADEVIVVDTGSTDATPRIAQEFGATVVHFPWTGSFSDARNESLRHAHGEWILFLDGDEALSKERENLRDMLRDADCDGFVLPAVSFVGHRSHREGHVHPLFRLFRRLPGLSFERNLHEQIAASIMEHKPEAKFSSLPVWIEHYGYLIPYVRQRQKVQRNVDLAKKDLTAAPTDPFAWFNLGREYLRLSRWQIAYYCFRRSLLYLDGAFPPYLLRAVCDAVTCLQQLGRDAQALELVQEAQRMPCTTPDFAFLEGQVRFHREDWSGAAEAFARCLQSDGAIPTFVDWTEGSTSYGAWYWIGLCRQKDGRLDDAVNAFAASVKAGLQLDRFYDPAITTLARLLCPECRSAIDLVATFESMCGVSLPEAPQLSLLLARALVSSYPVSPLAVETAQYALAQVEHWGDRVDASERAFVEGSIALVYRQFEAAAKAFAVVDDRAPEHGEAWNLSVLSLALAERWEEAVDRCGGDPVWLWLVNAWRTHEPASLDLVQITSVDCLRQSVENLLALLLQVHAFQCYEDTLPLVDRLWQDPHERWSMLGKLYSRFGFWDMVLETLLPVAQAGAADHESWGLLARACQHKGMHEQAAEILLALVHNADSRDRATQHYMALAGSLIAQGKVADARQILDLIASIVGPASMPGVTLISSQDVIPLCPSGNGHNGGNGKPVEEATIAQTSVTELLQKIDEMQARARRVANE